MQGKAICIADHSMLLRLCWVRSAWILGQSKNDFVHSTPPCMPGHTCCDCGQVCDCKEVVTWASKPASFILESMLNVLLTMLTISVEAKMQPACMLQGMLT